MLNTNFKVVKTFIMLIFIVLFNLLHNCIKYYLKINCISETTDNMCARKGYLQSNKYILSLILKVLVNFKDFPKIL